jgi:hypothetical protein
VHVLDVLLMLMLMLVLVLVLLLVLLLLLLLLLLTDPHKTRLRAFFETSYEGVMRMMEDPWLFVWHLHLLLTMMHFLTWISSYGWVGGPGPASITVGRARGGLSGGDSVCMQNRPTVISNCTPSGQHVMGCQWTHPPPPPELPLLLIMVQVLAWAAATAG